MGGGEKEEYNSETGSETKTDNDNDTSDDIEEELEGNKEYDFDGKMDFDGMEEYDFDGKMDFDGMEEYDFDGKMDFDGMEEYDFDGKLDFGEMDQNDEENRLEPTGESDISQESDSDTNVDNNDDQSSSVEQGNESYENLNSESISTVLICENKEEEGENLQNDDQGNEGIEEINQEELDKEIEKELEKGVEAIDQHLEQEAEFINAYQEMVGEARELDGERESEGEEHLKTEEEWEKEVETAAYTAEQLYEGMNESESDSNNGEVSEPSEETETEKEVEQNAEVAESQLSDLQEEFEVGMNEIEQHQVESLIEEALEAEPEPIVNEKEIEQLQERDLEEQFNEVHEKEEMEELIEWQDEQIEQEKEEAVEAQTDNSEEIISELEEEFEEGMNEIEQHQVDPLIEEALETEPEFMINEKEIEQLQELDLEKQFNKVHEKEEMEELIEWHSEQIEQEKEEEVETQTDNSEETISKLEEGINEIEQHQVDPLIEEALETDPEPIVNEKELENFQEMELEEQFQAIEFNDLIKDLAEQQEEDKIEQEKKIIEQTQEMIHQPTYLQEKLEEQELELEMEYVEKVEVERHQVEAVIEEELETEPKPIIREEELEYIKNFEPEKQLDAELFYELIEELKNEQNDEKEEHEELSTEEKVAQIKLELGIDQETKSGEAKVENNNQEEVLEHETISSDDSEQSKKIEQEAFNEIQSREENSNQNTEKEYEKLKKLYKQQTGKSPIYANLQTKGFKQWLEQKREVEKTEKTKREQDLKEENEKEEAWKQALKDRIERASEIEPELKSKLIKLLEKYNELEKLIKKYSQLRNKAQRKQLSQAEKNELNSLVKALLKLDPLKMELFLGLREIKRYIEDDDYYYYEYWNDQRHQKVFSHFFTQLSQNYNSLKQAQRKKNNAEKVMKNWIEDVSEEEISSELQAQLKKIVENYNELESIAAMFMKLYTKSKSEILSKTEQSELNSLVGTLQKIGSSKIELFSKIRVIRHYLNNKNPDELSNKTRIKQVLSKIFKHTSQEMLKFKELINPIESESFEKFMQYTHETELIKNLVNKFNKSGNWIKNLRPTQTFINFMEKKRKLLEINSQNSSSNAIKKQVKILPTYISLIRKIKENDTLTRVIRNLILKNKGKFNAYDIEQWLLISDTSARNQLKKMFTEEEYQEYVRTQEHVSIDTIEEIARKKGGKCLSKTLKNAKSKIHLECIEGHKFSTTYNSVVYSNSWCPECHIYVGEEICRQFCEWIFKRPFPKSYPPWLVNKKGNQMELDGNSKEIRVAFEYQGIQHRKKAFGLSDDDVKKIQEEDAYRLKKCQENGVILLQIPDEEILPYDKMQKYIIQQYESISGKALGNVPNYNYREFTIHENEHAKKFRAYVREKGGTLLTPYFTAKKEVTILCEQGHQWTTTPDSIYRNNWCSECAGNKKGTTEEYRKIGEKFQCELLNAYINAKTPLQYRCSKGHVFTKDPYWLKKDYSKIEILCPECKMGNYAKKFQNFIRNKGGSLLTPYKGRFKPIKIKCKNEHEWETTPGATYQGHWCKICKENKNNPNKKRQEAAKQRFLKNVKAVNYTLLSKYENNTKQLQIKCHNNHTFPITPQYFKRLVTQNIMPCKECRKNK